MLSQYFHKHHITVTTLFSNVYFHIYTTSFDQSSCPNNPIKNWFTQVLLFENIAHHLNQHPFLHNAIRFNRLQDSISLTTIPTDQMHCKISSQLTYDIKYATTSSHETSTEAPAKRSENTNIESIAHELQLVPQHTITANTAMRLTETQSWMKCITMIQIRHQPQISLTFPYRNEQNFSYITFANTTISYHIHQHYAIQFLSTKLNKFSQNNQCSTRSLANIDHTKLQSSLVFSSWQANSSQ